MRLPPGWDELEAFAKNAPAKCCRGVRVTPMNVIARQTRSLPSVSMKVLTSILKVAGVLAARSMRCTEHRGLLAIKGVIEVVEPEGNELRSAAKANRRGGVRPGRWTSLRCASARAWRLDRSVAANG